MDDLRLLCYHLKKKSIVFAVFAVYLRSINLSLLWKTELQTTGYYCYACSEYLPFSTEVGSVVSTVACMRFVDTIVWCTSVTFCVCTVLNYFGKINHIQLAYICDLFNKYTLVVTSFVAIQMVWNYSGITLVVQFMTINGSNICSDIPVWMIQNLEKIALSIVVFVLEFGALIRAREISFNWKQLATELCTKEHVADV